MVSQIQPGTVSRRFLHTRPLIILADCALFLLLYNLLPGDPQVVTGLSMLVFIAILWLTESLHVSVTALLVPIMAVLLGVVDTPAALSHFANPTIFLFLGGFALAAAMHVQGLDRVIANKVLTIARGKMSAALLMLFGTTAGLSMWISNTATAAMMMPLVLGILSKLDPSRQRSTYIFALLGVAYSASIGGIATIVGSPPNAIAAAEMGLSFIDWMYYGVPATLVLLPVAIGLLYLIFRPELQGHFEIDTQPVCWDRGKVMTLAVFGLTVFCWIFSQPMNLLLGGISAFDTLVALSAIILVTLSGVVDWKTVEKSADWSVLLLFGGGICLSAVLKETGTSLFLATSLSNLVADLNVIIIVLVLIGFVVFLTEFASNTASAALLIPVFAGVAEAFGLSPVLLSTLIAISASCAFMLPVATPPNAIVFASGYIEQRDMMRAGLVLNLACIVVLTLFSTLFWF